MYTFFKDNEQISQSDQSKITIEQISTNQRGVYACNVTSGLVEKTSEKVNVEGKDNGLFFYELAICLTLSETQGMKCLHKLLLKMRG